MTKLFIFWSFCALMILKTTCTQSSDESQNQGKFKSLKTAKEQSRSQTKLISKDTENITENKTIHKEIPIFVTKRMSYLNYKIEINQMAPLFSTHEKNDVKIQDSVPENANAVNPKDSVTYYVLKLMIIWFKISSPNFFVEKR